MLISRLSPAEYAGKRFVAEYETGGYYDIAGTAQGFSLTYRTFPALKKMSFDSCLFEEWLECPVAFGAFAEGALVGYVEGTTEAWNNRYRISNICVLRREKRRRGIGTLLMDAILGEAEKSGARMVVLETQSCNERAISFYRKNGFSLIGFDLYAYTNQDPERHEIRIEMGKKLERIHGEEDGIQGK